MIIICVNLCEGCGCGNWLWGHKRDFFYLQVLCNRLDALTERDAYLDYHFYERARQKKRMRPALRDPRQIMLNTWNLNSTIIHSPVELLSWVQISWFIDCIISNTYINVENRLLSIYNSQKAFLIKPFLKFNCVSSFVSSLTAMSSFLVHLWVR